MMRSLVAAIVLSVAATSTGRTEPVAAQVVARSEGEPTLSAECAILVDVATGQVLYEREADARREPASLTKIMTALLAIESGKLDETATVSKQAASTGESSVHLQVGDQVVLRDLLVAALLPSANDACVAIAEQVGGSLPAFVERMNARAAELGLTETHFENPHGLPGATHLSSARDLAALAREALRQPEFRQTVGTERAQFHFRRRGLPGVQSQEILSTNRLLRHEHPEHWALADGVKTGYTHAAGRCLCASATQDGWQLLCVVLGCKDSWLDARNLLTWGFAGYRHYQVVTANTTTAEARVIDGSAATVPAVAKSSIEVIAPADDPPPVAHLSEAYPEAPIRAGDGVGELVVSRRDGTQVSATLLATRDVPRSWGARVRDHLGALLAGVLGLALIGAVLIHGAVAKAAGPRRRRVAAAVRGDREGGTGDGQRRDRAASRRASRSDARPGAP